MCGGEALDDAHGVAAAGTEPEVAVRRWWQGKLVAALGREQFSGERQELLSEAVGEQAVVADAYEAPGQNVEEEAVQELHGVEPHRALLAVRMIPPAKADVFAVEGDEAMVADGHAVGVAAQVAEDMFRSTKRRLGVDVPFLPVQTGQQVLEPCRVTEVCRRSSAVEQVLAVKLSKPGKESLAELGAQDRDGQQEERVAGVDPPLVVG